MDKWDEAAGRAWDAIIKKVRALADSGQTYESLANLLGIKHRGTISLWLNGSREARNTAFPTMLRYLDRLGFDYTDFLPPPPTIKRTAPFAPVEKVEGEGLSRIPIFGSTGAGEDVEFFSSTPGEWLHILPNYYHAGIVGLRVEGDSMEPTIRKKAIVGVVPYEGSLVEGDVYLIFRPPFGRIIKRVKMGENGDIILQSDNPSYPDVVLPDEGYEQSILGHVRWVWQEL